LAFANLFTQGRFIALDAGSVRDTCTYFRLVTESSQGTNFEMAIEYPELYRMETAGKIGSIEEPVDERP
jgi:hypothetical protein